MYIVVRETTWFGEKAAVKLRMVLIILYRAGRRSRAAGSIPLQVIPFGTVFHVL